MGLQEKKYYDIEIDDDFISSFNGYVKEEIRKESINGRLNVEFNRLYYIGKSDWLFNQPIEVNSYQVGNNCPQK